MKIQVLISGFMLVAAVMFMANKKQTGLTGTIQDEQGFSIESSLEIYKDNTLVTTVETKEDGTFNLQELQSGDYKLVIKAQGYEDKVQTINVDKNFTDLGVIRLEDNHITLETAIIYGKKSTKKNFAGFF